MKAQTVVSTNVVEPKFDAAAFIKKLGTKSAAIRQLSSEGKTRTEIKNLLGIRYQHVRNVLITPIKKQAARVGTEADL